MLQMQADIARTRAHYANLPMADLCDCAYCQNYREKIRRAYPVVTDFLASLGIEAEKALETCPLEPDENGMLCYYACQYLVFGACDAAYERRIGDVLFRVATSYPTPGVRGSYFVLECGPICLPFKASRA